MPAAVDEGESRGWRTVHCASTERQATHRTLLLLHPSARTSPFFTALGTPTLARLASNTRHLGGCRCRFWWVDQPVPGGAMGRHLHRATPHMAYSCLWERGWVRERV
eukprot:6294853-Pyramimonas_sp.AAC.1